MKEFISAKNPVLGLRVRGFPGITPYCSYPADFEPSANALFFRGIVSIACMATGWPERCHQQFGRSIKEGFSDSSISMRLCTLEKFGPWDERLQAADFDLYFCSACSTILKKGVGNSIGLIDAVGDSCYIDVKSDALQIFTPL